MSERSAVTLWVSRAVAAPLVALPFVFVEYYDGLLGAMGPAFLWLLAASVLLASAGVVVLRDLFASLRLTVVLLTLGIFLIFFGTLAQVEQGIWEVVDQYFRSMVLWVPLDVFKPIVAPGSTDDWPGAFLFPGGFLLLGLLIMNLIAAHTVRYKVRATGGKLVLGWGLVVVSAALFAVTVALPRIADAIQQDVILMLGVWALPMAVMTAGAWVLFGSRKAGIVIVHVGLILLLVGEFVTGLAADEGQMMIPERGGSNFYQDIREVELALVTDLPGGGTRQVVVPRRMLIAASGSTEPIDDPALPVPIRVDGYLANSDLHFNGFIDNDPRRLAWEAVEIDTYSGTSQAQRADVPSAYVSLPTGEDRAWTRVMLTASGLIEPVTFEVDGVTWRMSLRFRRTYVPYTIQLHDFRSDTFTGSRVASNYSSDLVVAAPDEPAREAFIKMNQPLRYDGKAFFQADFFRHPLNRNTGTVLQVAENPGSWIPYLSCVVVTVGLCAQFGGSLTRYGRRTAAKGVG